MQKLFHRLKKTGHELAIQNAADQATIEPRERAFAEVI